MDRIKELTDVLKSKLGRLGSAVRHVTGEETGYDIDEMAETIEWFDGATGIQQAYILADENGNEVQCVVVSEEQQFDAGPNDIRAGKKAITDSGVTMGTKVIPSYQTFEGYKLIPAGAEFAITNFPKYEYTKLLLVICAWNTKIIDSVAVEKVVINGKVYVPGSTEALSEVVTSAENESISLGITNDSGAIRVMRYITYKEEY